MNALAVRLSDPLHAPARFLRWQNEKSPAERCPFPPIQIIYNKGHYVNRARMRNRLRLCHTAVKLNSNGQKRSGQSTSAYAAANAPPDSKTIFEQSDLRHFNILCSRIPEDQAAGAGEDLLYSCMYNSQNTPRHSGSQAVDGVKHAVRLSQLQRLGGAIVFLPSRGLFPCRLRSSVRFQAYCHSLLFDYKKQGRTPFSSVPGLFFRSACTAASFVL